MHFITAKSILTPNSMNLFRGCTHGCIYCDSRSRCYQFDHPFEDVAVKQNAPELLEAALRSKRRRCMIGTGSMCDPYLHAEKELLLTRRCLGLIEKYGFGAAVLTKSDLVLRDIDILGSINAAGKAVVQMTLTTYDEDLCRMIEPGVCTTRRRFEALCTLRDAGIPTVVWLCPILPFINDTRENIEGILDLCARAGVKGVVCFGIGMTLREGSREYYYAALDKHFPGLRRRYETTYGNAYELVSPDAPALMRFFHATCERHGIMHDNDRIFAYMNDLPEPYEQMTLF